MKNQRGFSNFSRSTECLSSRSSEFLSSGNFYPRDRRNCSSSRSTELFIFVIDGILFVAIDGIFIFAIDESSDRIKRSTSQAIDESSDRRIKRSIVSITLKICDREFLRNWNSGIPGKKEKEEKKIPIPTSPKRSTKDLFKALFFYTPWSEPEEECQHQTPRR